MTTTTKRPQIYEIYFLNNTFHFQAATTRIAAFVAMALTGYQGLCQRQDGKTITVAFDQNFDVASRIAPAILGLPKDIENPLTVFFDRNALAIGQAFKTFTPGPIGQPNLAVKLFIPYKIMAETADRFIARYRKRPQMCDPHQ